MMQHRDIDIGGRRMLRVGTFPHGSGEDAEVFAFLALVWEGSPLWPLPAQTITVPAAKVPELVAELKRLGDES